MHSREILNLSEIMIFQTAAGVLNGVISTVYFSDNFSSVLNKKKEFLVSACKERKQQIGYLIYSLLISRVHYISY